MQLELDTMLHEFEQQMILHRLKSQTSFLRLAVTATLEAVEELVHLRPAKGLDALLEIRSRKARDLEAELAAPGHEVAFISSARQRFASKNASAL
jgi:hypothetical protein